MPMQADNSFLKDQAKRELTAAAMHVGSSEGVFTIESRIVDEDGHTLESQCVGNSGDRRIVFFSQRSNLEAINFSRPSGLRTWGKLFKSTPTLLDSIRQLVNKLSAYKMPGQLSPDVLKLHAKLHAAGSMSSSNTEPSAAGNTAVIAMHWLDVGGAEAFAIDCIELAFRKGFKVIVICDCAGPLTWLHKIEKYVTSVYMLGSLDHQIRHMVCLELIQLHRPTLIHIHHCRTVYELLPALRAHGPECLVLDSTHIVENRHGGFVSVSQHYSEWIDFHHVISRTLEKFYIDAGLQPEKLKLGYLLGKKVLPAFEKKTAASPQPLRIGFIGRFVQQKRPYLFVELADRLNRKHPGSFAFGMIGSGTLEDQIKEQASASGAPIQFLPSQHDVKKFLSETDVLIICSDQEGLTLVAFEAIQNNCLILSSEVGAQHELIPDESLLPIAPYQLLRRATNLLIDIKAGKFDYLQAKEKQLEKYEALLQAPNAIDVCFEIYGRVTRGPAA